MLLLDLPSKFSNLVYSGTKLRLIHRCPAPQKRFNKTKDKVVKLLKLSDNEMVTFLFFNTVILLVNMLLTCRHGAFSITVSF